MKIIAENEKWILKEKPRVAGGRRRFYFMDKSTGKFWVIWMNNISLRCRFSVEMERDPDALNWVLDHLMNLEYLENEV